MEEELIPFPVIALATARKGKKYPWNRERNSIQSDSFASPIAVRHRRKSRVNPQPATSFNPTSSLSHLLSDVRNATTTQHSPSHASMHASSSLPSTPSSTNNCSLHATSPDEPTPKPYMSPYYFDEDNQVQLREGPPRQSPPPRTADLQRRKAKNEALQKHLDETYAVTFAGDVRAMTLTGMLFHQKTAKKNNKDGWQEMYCILDPYTKILSLHPSKSASKCYRALSLESARVIYGGEAGRVISSESGAKKKTVKIHCIELTVQPKHRKHYLASSDKTLTMQWVSDMSKVVHMGVDEKVKTKKMLQREDDLRKTERAANLIRQIKKKHQKPSEIERAKAIKRMKLDKDRKFREEYERKRVKTPKWVKEFSVDNLIAELSAEREATLADRLKVSTELISGFSVGEDFFEGDDESKEAVEIPVFSVEQSDSKSRSKSKSKSKSKVKSSQKNGSAEQHSHPLLPSYLTSALASSYHESRQHLYVHASATYIQRLYRGRLQRRTFLKSLQTRKFQVISGELCRKRRRFLASRSIIRWYKGRMFRRQFVYPIEDLFCEEKEHEVVSTLKQWLNLAPPEATEEQLARLIPKAQYKYSKVSCLASHHVAFRGKQ